MLVLNDRTEVHRLLEVVDGLRERRHGLSIAIDLSGVAATMDFVRFPDGRKASALGIRVSRQGPDDSAVTIDISEPVAS